MNGAGDDDREGGSVMAPFVVAWLMVATGALIAGVVTGENHEAATFVMGGLIMAKLSKPSNP